MKKRIKIVLVIFLIQILLSIIVYSNSEPLKLIGEKEANTQTQNSLKLNLTNDIPIGAIEGVVTFDENIEDIKISSGLNEWSVTYNENNGLFNAIKPVGATNEDILEITYKLKETSTNGKIAIEKVKIVTLDYDTIKLPNNVEMIVQNKENKKTEGYSVEDDTAFFAKKVDTRNTQSWIYCGILMTIIIVIIIIVMILKRIIKK